jgi:twinkle protein
MKGVHAPLPNRSVGQRITEKFGVTVDNGTIYYPYHNANGVTIGCKVRAEGKKFRTEGDITNAQLFGQHLWREGQKYVTITEGEEDALAVAEMFEGKYPVVSVKTGSGGALKDIKQNLEWLETFENIVLCFDNDDAGKEAVDQILPLFSPQKARIVNLPLKDASDMLQAGRVRDFVSAWWEAKEYRPVGIVKFGDDEAWEAFLKRGTEEIIPLPESYRKLNDMLNGGVAAGEITLISAFTSIGKTTLVYNLLYDMALNSGKRIGGVFLEASVGENVEKMLSLHVGENISQLKQEERDNEGYKLYYDDLGENADYFILDHQGQADIDILFAKLRWMALGADCDVVILDPLQAAIKAADNDKVDEFMDRCLKLVKQTGLSMIMVSHLNKPMSTIKDPHYVSEYDTKGSGSINQIAFNHIMMTRDKMSDDEYTQNSTQLHLVKNRRVGRTGSAGWLYYEESTGRMVEGNEPELEGIKDDEF